jgi:hypothetical protein
MPPSVLSPWYLVFKFDRDIAYGMDFIKYYVSPDSSTAAEEMNSFTTDKKRAMLFQTLQSAVRVAEAADAEIRVLYDKKHFKEFSR